VNAIDGVPPLADSAAGLTVCPQDGIAAAVSSVVVTTVDRLFMKWFLPLKMIAGGMHVHWLRAQIFPRQCPLLARL
jgi:hypothetical protein